LRGMNTVLLAYFIAKLVLFLVVFGALATEFYIFTGLVGLSVALNGAESRVPVEVESTQAEELAYSERLVTE